MRRDDTIIHYLCGGRRGIDPVRIAGRHSLVCIGHDMRQIAEGRMVDVFRDAAFGVGHDLRGAEVVVEEVMGLGAVDRRHVAGSAMWRAPLGIRSVI